MSIKHIKSREELTAAIAGKCVVDCFAEWCGPCKMVAPHFAKWAEENPDITFVKIDVDESEDLAASLGISAMPTFIFFKNGTEVDRVQGAVVGKIQENIANLKK